MFLKSTVLALASVTAVVAFGDEIPAGSTSIKIEEIQPSRSAREIRNEIKELDVRVENLGDNAHAAAVTKAPGQFTIGPVQSYGLTAARSSLKLAQSQAKDQRKAAVDELEKQLK